MLFYCRFTWYPGVNRIMVGRRLLQQHELGTNHPERIKAWYTLAGGGAGFMIVEAVGGWISGSLALLADAGHMLTDAGALGLSLLSGWIALRPATDRHVAQLPALSDI